MKRELPKHQRAELASSNSASLHQHALETTFTLHLVDVPPPDTAYTAAAAAKWHNFRQQGAALQTGGAIAGLMRQAGQALQLVHEKDKRAERGGCQGSLSTSCSLLGSKPLANSAALHQDALGSASVA